MSPLCWLLVVLAVVTPSTAFPPDGEQNDTAVSAFDLTQDPPVEQPYPYSGPEEDRPKDCQDLLASGHLESGVYTIWPRSQIFRGRAVAGAPLQVRCDMCTDGGGWTVIQRRGNFFNQENFYRTWKDYENGFGKLALDFWIGNNNIYVLTNQDAYSLRIDMTTVDGESAYELYRDFWIESGATHYTLHVDRPSGTAGDCLTRHNGLRFLTFDAIYSPAKKICAELMRGGFWYNYYNDCAYCNPNGLYELGTSNLTSMNYPSFKLNANLFSMEMKIKRL